MRLRARRDDTQTDIVEALRRLGVSVVDLASVGGGVPDLLLGYRGRTALAELKDGSKSPSRQQLTPDQEAFWATWKGSPIHLFRSVDEALRWALERHD